MNREIGVSISKCWDVDYSSEEVVRCSYGIEKEFEISLLELMYISRYKKEGYRFLESGVLITFTDKDADRMLAEYVTRWGILEDDKKGGFYDMEVDDLYNDYGLFLSNGGGQSFDEYVAEFEHQEGYLNPGVVILAGVLNKLLNGGTK